MSSDVNHIVRQPYTGTTNRQDSLEEFQSVHPYRLSKNKLSRKNKAPNTYDMVAPWNGK